MKIYDRQQGTGQPHIYSEHVEDFPIPAIPIESQKLLVANFYESHVGGFKDAKMREYLREHGDILLLKRTTATMVRVSHV